MNLLILLYLFLIGPKLLLDRLLKGKKHPGFLQRIGLQIPHSTKPVIWIHAVSVGEVKSAQPLFKALRQNQPDAFFLVTTTSATGQAEAKRTLSEADAFAYLPLDLTWVVNRWVKKLRPRHFILVESDFWPNLLSALKKNGTKISLVSGKMSERSAKRLRFFSSFSRHLFAHFDHICVQNELYRDRFLPLVPNSKAIRITGNLKFDIEPQPIDLSYWRSQLSLPSLVLTISCTHAPEEELLLDALKETPWFFILAPRHPERFDEVAHILQRKGIPFSRWSRPHEKRGGEKVLLLDAMGQLPIAYSLSRLAIVAGSYAPHVGGHNLLEPCLYGIPVLFGPHTFGQAELAKRVLETGAGLCVPLPQLAPTLATFSTRETDMRAAASKLVQEARGATARTLAVLIKAT